MNYPDKINTVEDFIEFSYKEKGSEFISQVFQCKTADEAALRLIEIKKKYYSANHHCYAYKLIDNTFKYSDDGEPSGTAGTRILNAIEHFDLVNQLVIVIRYFGGKKLGVGPLGKAYYKSAFKSLYTANIVTKHLYKKIEIKIKYDFISNVHKILTDTGSIIITSDYSDEPLFKCWISPAKIKKLVSFLNEISKGSCLIKEINEFTYS